MPFVLALLLLLAVPGFADHRTNIIPSLLPSVVVVRSRPVPVGNILDDMFKPIEISRGAGFFYSRDLIITSYHVLGDNSRVSVQLYNHTMEIPAKVVGYSKAADIALLHIARPVEADPPPLQIVKHISVGEVVYSIGHPYGYDYTVTQGIISHVSRTNDTGDISYIQYDAATNHGNSGGPLFNTDGQIIGIATAIISLGGGSDGIALAVDSETISKTILDILAKSY